MMKRTAREKKRGGKSGDDQIGDQEKNKMRTRGRYSLRGRPWPAEAKSGRPGKNPFHIELGGKNGLNGVP